MSPRRVHLIWVTLAQLEAGLMQVLTNTKKSHVLLLKVELVHLHKPKGLKLKLRVRGSELCGAGQAGWSPSFV